MCKNFCNFPLKCIYTIIAHYFPHTRFRIKLVPSLQPAVRPPQSLSKTTSRQQIVPSSLPQCHMIRWAIFIILLNSIVLPTTAWANIIFSTLPIKVHPNSIYRSADLVKWGIFIAFADTIWKLLLYLCFFFIFIVTI